MFLPVNIYTHCVAHWLLGPHDTLPFVLINMKDVTNYDKCLYFNVVDKLSIWIKI